MIYLDNSATTRVDDDVLAAMMPFFQEYYGNASSVYSAGRRARVAIEEARESLAHLIGAHPAEIYFTSGGTESNNAVLKSALFESNLVDTIVHSAIEHHAILHPAEKLAARGVSTHALPVTNEGFVARDIISEAAQNALQQRRTLLSVMHANNETGVIQPLRMLREAFPSVYLHTDAVQSFGKIPFSVNDLGIDFASFSAHKIHGPKGIGALYIKRGIDFKSHQQGGSQERNRRAGTEAVSLIVGFQKAAEKAHAEMLVRGEIMAQRIALLRSEILRLIPNIRINTPLDNALPNILNISFLDAERLDGEAILQAMDMRQIAVSNGSACVSGSLQPSHVLLALGLPVAEARCAVRFSVSKDTTEHEVAQAAEVLAEIVAMMRDE